MNPAFASWEAFVAMGGYGEYVWLALLFTVLPLLALTVHTLLARRAIALALASQQARLARLNAARKDPG